MSRSITSWYREGTIGLTEGSKDVEGTLTYWESSGIKAGDMLTVDNGASFLEIDRVIDNTHLTLRSDYTGETTAETAYAVVRQFNATMPARLAARLARLLGIYQKYLDANMTLTGKSAYEIAVENGYNGTESEWLESLKAAGEISMLKSRCDKLEDTVVYIGEMDTLKTDAKATLVEAVNEVVDNIGPLPDLTTDAKDSIVNAINEIDEHADTNTKHIGEMSDLSTTANATLVEAINEVDNHADLNAAHIGKMSDLTTDAHETLVQAIVEVDSHADTNASHIGNLNSLRTDAKASLVNALNEVDIHTDTNTTNIGTLSQLRTDAKGNLVAALNEVDSHTDTNTANIGAITGLRTDAKNNLVAALNEVDTHVDENTAAIGRHQTKLNGIEDGANKYIHPSYSTTTGAESGDQSPGFGGTFSISQVKSDGSGHISGQTTRTVRIPNTEATQSSPGLMSAGDKKKLDNIESGVKSYTHPTYTARTGVPTGNASPGFGGSFEVTQPVSDGTGHITALNSRTIYIPSSVATTSAAGLMSALDKQKLNGLSTTPTVNASDVSGLTDFVNKLMPADEILAADGVTGGLLGIFKAATATTAASKMFMTWNYTYITSSNIQSSREYTVTFNTPFPFSCVTVIMGLECSDIKNINVLIPVVHSRSKTGFTFYLLGADNYNETDSSIGFAYLAIGM